ncbi:epimerase [Methanocella sp. CWC-04]|uniref:Epimerase n=1 Tax=Methanooceanicella nereidis TaxID=2052831 RepID=A0AAP2RD31_9EURY|nr:NAD-dependent epimerase/dehydratase family protein [Methanocella sp. CWC-04]MCD1294892.1 epimerase [Methanocella sp. CWC-04]
MQSFSVLLTGGLGQVGSYLCEELLGNGHDVVILDNMSSTVNICPEKAKFVKGDIRDKKTVEELMRDSDAVIHCAAQIFVTYSIENPLFDAENNVIGTLNLLDAARNSDIKRFVYFSSAAVYGDPVRLPVDETHPQDPMSPYGVSKLSGEKYALAFNKIYGLPSTAIRPFNIYSPRQDPSNPYSGVISKFIDRAGSGMNPIIFGDGSATRDFVSVHDVVDMVMLMLEKEAAVGKVFNCGTGNITRIDELARTVIELYGKPGLEPEFLAERPGDIKYSYADISRAKKLLGYEPKVALRDGLIDMIEFKKMNQAKSTDAQ